jgi:hypothetical protein
MNTRLNGKHLEVRLDSVISRFCSSKAGNGTSQSAVFSKQYVGQDRATVMFFSL